MSEDFSKIPQSVKRRISWPLYLDNVDLIMGKHQLAKEKMHEFVALEKDVILGEVKVEEIGQKLKEIFNLEEAVNNKLASDFIGYQFLPLQDFLGDVTAKLKELGGNLDKYIENADTILQPGVIFWEDLAYVWGEAGFNIDEVSPEQKHNYFNIIINFLNNKIKDEELVNALVTDVGHGGAGVAAEKAEIIAEWTINLVEAGDITIDNFRELDGIRQQILGEKTTSILEAAPVDLSAGNLGLAEGLLGQIKNFLTLPELEQIMEQLSKSDKKAGYDEIKNQFYEAINSKDRLGFVTALAKIFSSGKVKELFTNDERYVKFWRNRILKDKGLEGVRKFDENSLRREQFGSFIRHVIEERFEIPPSDAVLWGVFLSSLAHRAGDTDYDRLAYGDLTDQKFKWNL